MSGRDESVVGTTTASSWHSKGSARSCQFRFSALQQSSERSESGPPTGPTSTEAGIVQRLPTLVILDPPRLVRFLRSEDLNRNRRYEEHSATWT